MSTDDLEKKVDEVKQVVLPLPPAMTVNTILTIATTLISAITPIMLGIIALFGGDKLQDIQVKVDGRLSETISHVESLQSQVEALGGPKAPETRQEEIDARVR